MVHVIHVEKKVPDAEIAPIVKSKKHLKFDGTYALVDDTRPDLLVEFTDDDGHKRSLFRVVRNKMSPDAIIQMKRALRKIKKGTMDVSFEKSHVKGINVRENPDAVSFYNELVENHLNYSDRDTKEFIDSRCVPDGYLNLFYNQNVGIHTDRTRIPTGMCNYSICGEGFEKGYTMFPQYKVAVVLKEGDFLCLNRRELHCVDLEKYDHTNYRCGVHVNYMFKSDDLKTEYVPTRFDYLFSNCSLGEIVI